MAANLARAKLLRDVISEYLVMCEAFDQDGFERGEKPDKPIRDYIHNKRDVYVKVSRDDLDRALDAVIFSDE